MFWDVVEQTVETLAVKMVRGTFHIGLDAVKRYVLFWCMANHLQENQMEQKMSIEKYAASKFSLTSEEKEKLKQETIERLSFAFYERKLDHYNTMNAENKMKLLLRQKQETYYRINRKEKEETEKGNVRRFEGLALFPYQLDEFSILDAIKEGEYTQEVGRTYKRIVSDKGYLQKMTFKEYKELVTLLSDEIDQSQALYKNVATYKLEKRLGFEALKAVLKALSECREKNHVPDQIAARDLITILQLPFLSERQRYAKVYPDLDLLEQMKWRIEIKGILMFTQACILATKQKLAESNDSILQPEDWERFQTLYIPKSYENDYKLRKDFRSDDFTLIMTELDKLNMLILEESKKSIEEKK
ncbi:class A beta-lactamase-related serine hydrolase [Brevibacillus borstelensis]|uniref:class A beta-lactamase-related serine hydrolase n=1 Tax=Brevibacillus borstelensis TaxID=45462 RepID=UPI00203A8473|nr:class A beta-lactamase-related serine hydrolase [Brevibacillus borstelensis]MCM3625528.1 class A beta-lactamase-related serine hydrolase [Brevibacillus borstelensis]